MYAIFKSAFVSLCLLNVATLTHAKKPTTKMGDSPKYDAQQQELSQDRLSSNSLYEQRESVWWIDSMPHAGARHKAHKLNHLNKDLHAYFLDVTGLPGAATFSLFMFYLVASYVPSILLTLLLSCMGCGSSGVKDEKPRSGFVFN